MQKSILITGCSSGIGLNTAQTLHNKGYRVFATARKAEDVKKLQELGLESFILDVDDSNSIQEGVEYILEKTGGTLYALFNNAGFGIPGAVEDLTRDLIRAQFETNVFGPMELIKLVLPIMRKQGAGRIIQNCSILGIITMPYRGAYNASKFALEGFSNTLRQELRGTNIYVSIIEPGAIKSSFRNNAFKMYQNNLSNELSIHKKVYANMQKEFESKSADKVPFTLPPDAVTKKIIHALESKKPSAHYYIGITAKVFAFLRRILPDSILDWVTTSASGQEAKWQKKQEKL